VTFALCIVQVLCARNIGTVAAFYAMCLVLASLSRINIIYFLKRTWVFIPLFSLCLAVPALFDGISPGDTLVAFPAGSLKFIITRQGAAAAALFIARVTASLSFAVLMSLTTRHCELLKVLRVFKVPSLFVMTLGMCYRYIYLFAEIVERTYVAIKSRIGVSVRDREGRGTVAWNIASLWARSYRLNEEVYTAMLSRGYRGEAVADHDFRVRTPDWVWIACCGAVAGVAIYVSCMR